MKWIALIATAMVLWSCTKETKDPVEEVKSKASIPSGLFVSASPENAVPVLEARKLKAGDKVVVHGKVMGSKHPFVEGRALFIIGDPEKLKSCDVRPDDECPQPWDVCCETTEDIAAGTVSVQVVGEDGRPLKTGIKGQNGLDNLSNVVIEGTVAKNTTAAAMTINADKIYIKK